MSRQKWGAAEWSEANIMLHARAGGRCEICYRKLSEGLRIARHHRQRRAVGGDRLSNLLLIHEDCHIKVHAQPAISREAGWIVSSYEADPSAVPVAYQRSELVLLDDFGLIIRP